MTSPKELAQIVFNNETNSINCRGAWSISTLDRVLATLNTIKATLPTGKKIAVNNKAISHFDSAGALALTHLLEKLKQLGKETELTAFNKEQLSLIELIQTNQSCVRYQVPPPQKNSLLYEIGEETIHKLEQADGFVVLLGELSQKFFEACAKWRRFQLPSIVSNIDATGIKALPIIALLSFLIGIVLAYQMGLQLQTYGANIFIAYLSGMAIFREFAPLITAIIVAGRTSSAFTAQIGSMKINEEIDALLTMGLSPVELLVMPKVMGLLIVLPLVIFWADIFSILGAMVMSKWMLDVSYVDFLVRLKDAVGLKQMMLGLYKAPAFAIIVAMVGCFQGFLVESNADSIGSQTTKSVVQALFLIIIADAIFSIVYSWLGV